MKMMSGRAKKWSLSVVLFIACLFAIIRLTVFFWLNPVVEDAINKAVELYSGGLYHVSYDDVKIRPLQRRIQLSNFKLLFDSTQVRHTKEDEDIFIRAEANEIVLAVGKMSQLFFHRYLNVEQVSLVRPAITVYNYAQEHETRGSTFNAFEFIHPYLDSAKLEYVSIHDGAFKIVNIYGKPFQDFEVRRISATALNIRVDSTTTIQGYPDADEFLLSVDNAQYLLPDSLSHVMVGRSTFDPINKEIRLSQVELSPIYPKYEFAREIGYRKDWIKGYVGEILMKGIDLNQLIASNVLNVSQLALDSVSLLVFHDRNLPPRDQNQTKTRPLFDQMIKSVAVPFSFDTITVVRGSVAYEEKAPEALESGEIFFDDLSLSVYHVSNMHLEQPVQAEANALLMGQSEVQVFFDIPLNREDHLHFVNGHLGEFPLTRINKMMEPTAYASIQSGVGHQLSFQMQVDQDKAVGSMLFEYSDLKVALLNKKDPEEEPKLKHKIGSAIANLFIVKDKNQNDKDPMREGIIAYRKPDGSPIFSYWSHALLSGVKMSIGLENQPDFPVDDSIRRVPHEPEKEKPGLLKRIFSGGNKEKP